MNKVFLFSVIGVMCALGTAFATADSDTTQAVWQCKAVGFVKNTGNAFAVYTESSDMAQTRTSALQKCEAASLLACENAGCDQKGQQQY